jgi:TonB-linked SusC/RagA family outer membrane protein
MLQSQFFSTVLVLSLSSLPVQAQHTTDMLRPVTDSLGIVEGSAASLLQGGSVDVIDQKRMRKGLVTSSLDALSGQAAGVNVSSGGTDRTAMLSAVRVRGTTSLTGGNDPLVIIDGVYSDLSTLSSIYPADIASFSILKNAAETAPYGSRGASGVIQVTTRKGQGSQFHISYDGNVGFESAYPQITMLRAADYISTARSLGLGYVDGGYDTDFQRVILRTGLVHNHHVAFSGGGETSNYRASLGYMGHNTVVRNSRYNNFIAKIDLSQKAFDDLLTIDFGVFGSSQKNQNIFDTQKLFYSAAAQNPTLSRDRNTSGGWDKNSTASQINPPQALLYEQDHDKLLNFNTHLQFTFTLSRFLTLNALGSYSYNSTENAQYLPTWVWALGQAYRGEAKTEDWLGHLALNYKHNFGGHILAAMIMGEYQSRLQRGFFTTVKGFSTNDFGYDNLTAAATIPYGGTGSNYDNPRLASAMMQVSYDHLGLFSLTANARVDGSSMFGKGNKWGFFPSLSGEWNVLRTLWRNHGDWINGLRLRMGYGISGNTGGIESYNSMNLLHTNGMLTWNGTPATTLGITSNANPDLKWETRSTFNIGTDIALWHNRIVITAEYYYSKTTDMLYLYDVPVPPFAYNKLLANIGSMSNSGLEIGLGVTAIQHRDLELNINVNLSLQRNRLLSLSGSYNGTQLSAQDITPIGGLNGAGFHGGNNNIVYQIVGQPLGVFYLPHCNGLVKNAQGRYMYDVANLDNDPEISLEDGADRYIAGQATPKATLGSNISLRYKDFDIAIQMNGAFGHKIYNGTSLTYMNMTSFPTYNVMVDAPKQNIGDQIATDYWLERGDYVNIDYITVGWNVPIRRLGRYISGLRLSLSANNVATLTGYSGQTPIINSYVVNSTLGIDDKRSFPPTRTFSMGVSIQF